MSKNQNLDGNDDEDPCVPENQRRSKPGSLSFSLSLVLSFVPVRYPSELNLLLPLYLSLYLPCGLANKNKTQNARRRGGKRRGVCEWVYVCELDILSRPGGGQFLRWPSFLAVGRFVVWGLLLLLLIVL